MMGIMICLSAFAGCSKEEKKIPEVTQTVDNTPKPTLKMLKTWAAFDYNKDPLASLLQQKTGYQVEYTALPQDGFNEKLNLIMASGEEYDLISVSQWSKSQYFQYANNGALTDLTPLLDKYGTNIISGADPKAWELINAQGKKFGIPIMTVPNVAGGIVIRKDWLDKVDKKVPTTVDEFSDVLRAFKTKDPGGNGDKNIPLVDGGIIGGLTNAFGLISQWMLINDKVVVQELTPQFKEYLDFVHSMYNEKLIDQEFPVNKPATIEEKFTSGKAGAMYLRWVNASRIITTLLKVNPNATYAYIPFLNGKVTNPGIGINAGLGTISFIPKSSKNAEHAVKWLNQKLDKDLFKLVQIGEENVHYKVEAGNISPILPKFMDERGNANMFTEAQIYEDAQKYYQVRLKRDKYMFDAYDVFNNKIPKSQVVYSPMTYAPNLPLTDKNSAALNTLTSDYVIKACAVEGTTKLEEFIKKWKAQGGDDATKEINDWYAANKKK